MPRLTNIVFIGQIITIKRPTQIIGWFASTIGIKSLTTMHIYSR